MRSKKIEEKLTSNLFVDFLGKSFRHGLFWKNISIVFLNSAYRETSKNVLKIKKKHLKLVGSSKVIKYTSRSVNVF
jgi:hypothetical protein